MGEKQDARGNAEGGVPATLPITHLDGLMEGCQIIDRRFRYVYVNGAAAAHGRRTVPELVGRRMREVYPGIEETPMFAELRRCMETRAAHRLENEFVFPDGSRGWFELRIEPVPEGVFILSLDITELRHQLAARAAAEKRVRHLNAILLGIRNVNQLLVRERDPGRLIHEACALLVESRGFDACLVVRLDDGPVDLAGAGLPDRIRVLEEVVSTGRMPWCIRRVTADGERTAHCSPTGDCLACRARNRVRDDRRDVAVRLECDGKLYGALLVTAPSDVVTDPEEIDLLVEVAGDLAFGLRNAEIEAENARNAESLRRTKERLAALVDASPAAIYSLSRDGRITAWSRGAERVFGWSAEEVIGEFLPFLSEENRAEFDVLRARILTGEPFSGVELTRSRKDGTEVEVSLSAAPLRGERGDVTGFVAVALDISDRRNVEEEKRRLRQQLRQSQKLEAIGRLAGGVAHDFNNALTVILGFVELAERKLGNEDPARPPLKQIRDAAGRAARLTGQLLAFGRKQVLEPTPLDLNATIREIDTMLRRLIGEHIELELALADDLGVVLADASQVEQVIVNLAVNARDAMPAGGRLLIETADVELDSKFAARHVGVAPGSYVSLVVTDTGEGMDAETRAHAFEPFYTTKELGRGTGLGLATVYGIVRQSGGNIWIYSEPGAGTSVKVYLPRSDGAPVEADEPSRTGAPAGGTETILLAEDEAAVRELTREILEEAGYRVVAVADGEEAIAAARSHDGPLHLVLTDVVMPRMSGPTLAERIRDLRPATRVLYMSGYTDHAAVRLGALRGRFLGKPFRSDDLLRAVRDALDAEK